MRSAPARNAKPPTRPAAQVRRGRIDLGIGMSRTLATIAADRLGDAFGRSLPRTPEHLADVRVINALVEASAGSGARTLPPLERASLAGVTFPSSNCTNFLVDLECADEADDAPRTAYAKIPCRELATRAFAGALGFWKVELAFCRSLAGRMPVRVPTVYAAQERGARERIVVAGAPPPPNLCVPVNAHSGHQQERRIWTRDSPTAHGGDHGQREQESHNSTSNQDGHSHSIVAGGLLEMS